ncbi:MAG: T9SS type A sorting domain-containing protein [Bacteroidales bacterium]|nr:T9SS type A sorting domain-containing protein [Bacteroidales bacterium]
MIKVLLTVISCLLSFYLFAQYPPAAGLPGSTAIHKDSSIISGWAKTCVVSRGYINIEDTSATFTLGEITSNHVFSGHDSLALNYPSNAGSVSLGDGGYALITFSSALKNEAGPDFAVFENAFQSTLPPYLYFLELAFVEVSSDGENFVRFPSYSLIQDSLQTDSYGQTNPELIHNLAGKYVANYGTPFDLEDLKDSTSINLDRITHVKIIDVGGTINPLFASRDCMERIINDPFPTAFASGGFDLNAVAAINFANNEGVELLENKHQLLAYPNPIVSGQTISLTLAAYSNITQAEFYIYDISGLLVKSVSGTIISEKVKLNLYLQQGIYYVKTRLNENIFSCKIIVL